MAAANLRRSMAMASTGCAAAAVDITAKAHGAIKPRVLSSPAITALFTTIRCSSTPSSEFVVASNRLFNILVEESLASLPGVVQKEVRTPCGSFKGLSAIPASDITVVSVMRAGDCLADAFRRVMPAASIGRILIQRDEESKEKLPVLLYNKLPPSVADKKVVILVDPMLATGGSACSAIRVLRDRGVQESRIVFVNVVACPEGLARIQRDFPDVTIVTAAVDEGLNASRYIVPGLGDFGDRFYGTEST